MSPHTHESLYLVSGDIIDVERPDHPPFRMRTPVLIYTYRTSAHRAIAKVLLVASARPMFGSTAASRNP